MLMQATEVAIVGGGVAGLSCALALADAGLQVTVLEGSPRLGGRASSMIDEATGDAVDLGPHVLASDYRNLLALLERLGTQQQVVWQPQPMIVVHDGDRRLRMRSSRLPAPLHALPDLPRALRSVSLRDLLSNLRLGWRVLAQTDTQTLALDDRRASDWLAEMGVTPRFVQWFWASASMALLNVPLEQCSAAALARLARMLAGRSGIHFGFPRGALVELFAPACRAAIERSGSRVLVSTRAARIAMRDGRCAGVTLDDGRLLAARAVVVAVPPQSLRELASAEWLASDPAPSLASRFAPSPYVSTYLWFDRKVTDERFWARVWSPGSLNLDFYDLSNIRGHGPGAPSLIASNAIHAVAAQALADDEIVRRTQAEIAAFAPAAADARIVHAAVHRIPMAICAPHPGTERMRPAARTPFENLWLAGDWTRTGLPSSMESAARSGAIAAELAAAYLGKTIRVSRPVPQPEGLAALVRRIGQRRALARVRA